MNFSTDLSLSNVLISMSLAVSKVGVTQFLVLFITIHLAQETKALGTVHTEKLTCITSLINSTACTYYKHYWW